MISVTQWTPENSLENTIKSIEKPRRTVSATLISLFFIFPHSAIAVPYTTTAKSVWEEGKPDSRALSHGIIKGLIFITRSLSKKI